MCVSGGGGVDKHRANARKAWTCKTGVGRPDARRADRLGKLIPKGNWLRQIIKGCDNQNVLRKWSTSPSCWHRNKWRRTKGKSTTLRMMHAIAASENDEIMRANGVRGKAVARG